MNFFKQQELDILSKYPKHQQIPLRNYICDFVLNNPLNFPYSTYIMKLGHMNKPGTPVKDYYKKEIVMNQIDCMPNNSSDTYKFFVSDIFNHCSISFTTIAYILISNHPKATVAVHQIGENTIVSINDYHHKFLAMIDSTAQNILCYASSCSASIYYQISAKQFKDIAEFSKILKIEQKYYMIHFPDQEFEKNASLILKCITGCEIPSWRSDICDVDIPFEFKHSLLNRYSIMRMCDSDFECMECVSVIKEDINKDAHSETVSQCSILDHVV